MKTPLSYIEISRENLLHNFELFRKLLPSHIKVACVVKANAYGHGISEVVNLLKKTTDYFQVDDAEEFLEVYKITSKPILILGYVQQNDLALIIERGAEFVVYDLERLPQIELMAKRLKTFANVHIKIDAFLGRQGLLVNQLALFLVELKKCKHINVLGVYAHFANIEDTTSFAHAQKQINEFKKAKVILKTHGFSKINTHISSTSGVLAYEQKAQENSLVRLGLGLYGLWPSSPLKKVYLAPKVDLKPVLRWLTKIAQVKLLPKNHPVGYGLTYTTTKNTKIAIIPQGYSDGYDRGFSNNGFVLIHGKRCKVIGRISMNMFAVNVSHLIDVKPEEEVVLIGNQGKECILAEELGEQIKTINYEITARLSPKIPRIVV